MKIQKGSAVRETRAFRLEERSCRPIRVGAGRACLVAAASSGPQGHVLPPPRRTKSTRVMAGAPMRAEPNSCGARGSVPVHRPKAGAGRDGPGVSDPDAGGDATGNGRLDGGRTDMDAVDALWAGQSTMEGRAQLMRAIRGLPDEVLFDLRTKVERRLPPISAPTDDMTVLYYFVDTERRRREEIREAPQRRRVTEEAKGLLRSALEAAGRLRSDA